MCQVEEGHKVWQPGGLPVLRPLPGLEQELGRMGRRDKDPEGQHGELRKEGEAILTASGQLSSVLCMYYSNLFHCSIGLVVDS